MGSVDRPPVDEEAGWIEAVADGDDRALRSLYDALAGIVYALTLRITDSREDAEEVLQDTFVRVHEAAERFDRSRGSARAWVYTIARNLARMKVRRRGSRPFAGVDPERTRRVPSDLPGPAANATDRLALERAFAELDDHEVDLLRDAFFGGFSHSELAERDGIPLGTVKSRIRRAMLKARSTLTGSSDPDAGAPGEASS